jgi:predicted Zn-dependent peptidase
VGDVTLDELRPLAERYFSDIPAGPKPPAVTAVEPEQTTARRTVLTDAAQPAVMMGWHIPAASDPRYDAYAALADLLGGSDYARLQRALVRDQGLSVNEETTIGFPGERFPCLWGLISIPASGVAPDSLEREVARVLDDVQSAHPLTQDELDGYKVRVRVQKLAAVEGNSALADQLSMAQALRGDWREFFRAQERVDALTLADLTAAMRLAFRRTNCTTAMIVNPPADSTTVGH